MLLIFPTQIGLDRNHIPWLTLSLIVLTVACMFMFQMDDSEESQEVFHYYQTSGLFSMEVASFQQYLETPAAKEHYRDISAVYKEGPGRLYFMVFDQAFRRYLLVRATEKSDAQSQQWYYLAKELDNKKMRVTHFAYGARPDNLTQIGVFTHMFLHGGFGHLIGNMLFLFLFGFGVERLFGQLKFLLIYFASGVVGAVVFSFLEGKPYMPLIGASGAISGLMGAYAGYFGLQKIRFFIWFGVYFNHFKWPALLILIYWLGKEFVYQITDTESNVAYLAHFGGLAAGGILGFLLRPRKARRESASAEEKTNEDKSLYLEALEHIRKLDLDKARVALLKTLRASPNHLDALKSLYNLDKVNPKHRNYRDVVNRVFSINLDQHQADDFVLKVAEDAMPNHLVVEQLEIDAFFGLVHRQLRNDRVQQSEPLVKQAKKAFAQHEQLPKLLFQWSLALAKRKKIRSASIELNYLANYYGETAHGKAAREQLARWKKA